MPSWRQTSISGTVVASAISQKSPCLAKFLGWIWDPSRLYAQWDRGSGTEHKPQGSCAARDAPHCVLAWSEATPWPELVLWAIPVTWVTALSHVPPCDSGTCPIHRMSPAWFSSVELLMMEGAHHESCCVLKGCKNENSDSTLFFIKLLSQAAGQVF